MEDLVKYIVENLVENKDSIELKSEETERTCVLTILVNKEDIGKVVGKKGKTISAIRSLDRGAAGKMNKVVTVEVND